MIPVEINLCSAWVSKFDTKQNEGQLTGCLDLLEEHQQAATIRLAEYQQKLAQRYDQGVRVREFSAGDLVLRKAVVSMRDTNARMLAQTWEGQYRVTTIVGVGAYYLEDLNEVLLP